MIFKIIETAILCTLCKFIVPVLGESCGTMLRYHQLVPAGCSKLVGCWPDWNGWTPPQWALCPVNRAAHVTTLDASLCLPWRVGQRPTTRLRRASSKSPLLGPSPLGRYGNPTSPVRICDSHRADPVTSGLGWTPTREPALSGLRPTHGDHRSPHIATGHWGALARLGPTPSMRLPPVEYFQNRWGGSLQYSFNLLFATHIEEKWHGSFR